MRSSPSRTAALIARGDAVERKRLVDGEVAEIGAGELGGQNGKADIGMDARLQEFVLFPRFRLGPSDDHRHAGHEQNIVRRAAVFCGSAP